MGSRILGALVSAAFVLMLNFTPDEIMTSKDILMFMIVALIGYSLVAAFQFLWKYKIVITEW